MVEGTNRDVWRAVFGTVDWAVWWPVNQAVDWAVVGAVSGAVEWEPALKDFLREVR